MFYDLGPADIPPAPSGVAMLGRDDGLLYWLSDDGAGGVLLNQTSLPRSWGATVRDAFDGPVLPSPLGRLRLYITGAALQYELADPRSLGVTNQRILSRRRGHTKDVYELTAEEPFSFGDALTFTLVSGTPVVVVEVLRITESGEIRITEDGQNRILED